MQVNEKQLVGNSIGEVSICEKAMALYDDLLCQTPGSFAEEEGSFKASGGWFYEFKNRTGIYCVAHNGETAGANLITRMLRNFKKISIYKKSQKKKRACMP